jgi:hypothetical protein
MHSQIMLQACLDRTHHSIARSIAVLTALRGNCSRVLCWLIELMTCFTLQILGNFGMDVLEALSGTCTLWVAGRRPTSHLAADLAVALGITCTHAVTLMCQVR